MDHPEAGRYLDAMSMDIGRVGVWTRTDSFSTIEAIEFAQRVEELGYGALWIPDAFGRDPFAHASLLLNHTSTLVLATGVVNIHLREAQATTCAQRELHDQSGGRFLLGLGVSHQAPMERMQQKPYPAPIPSMREYLDKMDSAMWWGPELDGEPPMVLAALGPLMLKLAAERTMGAHPYFAPPENSRRSREIMGARCLDLPRAKGDLGNRPAAGPRKGSGLYGGADHHAQLPQQPHALRVRGERPRQRRQRRGGRRGWWPGATKMPSWNGCASTTTPAPPTYASSRSIRWTKSAPSLETLEVLAPLLNGA